MAALALLASASSVAQDWLYTVRPGDNLWDLSEAYLERGIAYVERLQQHNAIADPHRLPPGSKLRFPVRWLKVRPAAARVVNATGEVMRFSASDPGGSAVGAGDTLGAGDRLTTGPAANALVRFADGSRMLLGPASAVVMDTMSAFEGTGMVDTRLRLERGRTVNDVLPAAGPGSRYRIQTPPAVAAVRGTGFRIGLDESGELMRSEVTEGRIGVEGGGSSRAVEQGFGLLAVAGEPPRPPQPLLPAPDLSGFADPVERTLIEFTWPAVENAVAYHALLFDGASFDRLREEKTVSVAALEWNAPPDGAYRLRLRAIDRDGLEGLDADHDFVLNARPEPPLALGPRAGGTALEEQPIELWWSLPAHAVSFRLELAADERFETLLLERDALTGDRERSAPLPPGTYHWRLATRDASGELGPYGDTISFRVLAVPDAVAAEEPALGEEDLTFAWQRAADTAHYEFQLARDEAFEDIVEARTLPETTLTLPRPDPGTYYFRARGVSAEAVPGPYSAVNRVEIPGGEPWWLLLLLPLLLLL